MSTATRLAAFAGGLVLAFATAWGIGDAVPPVLDEPAPSPAHEQGADHDD
jgi:hypothetical protein